MEPHAGARCRGRHRRRGTGDQQLLADGSGEDRADGRTGAERHGHGGWQAAAAQRARVSLAGHQHQPRSAMGPHLGGVRRGYLADLADDGGVREGHAGGPSPVPEAGRHAEALRRQQRGARPDQDRHHRQRADAARVLPAALQGGHRRGQGVLHHVVVQRDQRHARRRTRVPAQDAASRRVEVRGVHRPRQRRGRAAGDRPSQVRDVRGSGGKNGPGRQRPRQLGVRAVSPGRGGERVVERAPHRSGAQARPENQVPSRRIRSARNGAVQEARQEKRSIRQHTGSWRCVPRTNRSCCSGIATTSCRSTETR